MDINLKPPRSSESDSDEINTLPAKIKPVKKTQVLQRKALIDETDNDISDVNDGEDSIDTSLDLETENSNHKDDGDDTTNTSSNDSPKIDNQKKINDALHQKNKYIKEILHDLQKSEEENKILKVELSRVKDKLSDATASIKKQTILITNAKSENIHYSDQINKYKDIQTALQSQIEILTESNKKSEIQLDEFIHGMDTRINNWVDVLDTKESEINELKAEINKLQERLSLVDQRDPEFFNEMIKQRDTQIDDLRSKLSEATDNILIMSRTLGNLKKQDEDVVKLDTPSEIVEDLRIEKYKSECKKMKVENEDLEYCLQLKEVELTDALERINVFESGEFGIKEAIQLNKQSKQQLKIREEQIKSLVSESNEHVKVLGQLQLENSIMRKKLNLPPEQIISTDNLLGKYSKLKKELNITMKKVSLLDEQNVSLKIRLRQKEKTIQKVYSYVKNLGIKIPEQFLAVILVEENTTQQAFEADNNVSDNIDDTIISSDVKNRSPSMHSENIIKDSSELENNYKLLSEENKKLKNRINHVINILKEKANDSSEETLPNMIDQLLNTMNIDAVNECDFNYSEEMNIEHDNHERFKSMLKDARMEIFSTLELLTIESQKNLDLQQKLTEIHLNQNFQQLDKEDSIESMIDSCKQKKCVDSDDVSSSIDNYLQVMNQSYVSVLHENLKHFHKQFKFLYDSMTEIFTENSINQNQWSVKEESYKKDIEELTVSLDAMKIKYDELYKLKNISTTADEIGNADNMSDDIKLNLEKYPIILSEREYFNRKANYLEDSVKYYKNDYNNLKQEYYQYKMEVFEKNKYYEIELQKYKYNVANVKNELRNSISLDRFLKINLKLSELQIKYRKLIDSDYESQSKSEHNENSKAFEYNILSEKWDLLQKENSDLVAMLKSEKEKQLLSIHNDNADEKIKSLSSQLADFQMNIVSLIKKCEYLEKMNSTLSNQLNTLYLKLDDSNETLNVSKERIEHLQRDNFILQENQNSLINKAQIACLLYEPNNDEKVIDAMKQSNDRLNLDNLELNCKLRLLEEQIVEINHNKLVNDLETNILRHQVLDLQSGNDNKAIVARLSGEILVSHIHTTELHSKKEKLTRILENMKNKCDNLEKVIQEKDLQFDNYVSRSNFKISFLSSALQVMREQYQGSIPLAVLENIKNTQVELKQKMDTLKEQEKELFEKSCVAENHLYMKLLESIEADKCTYEDNAQCPHNVALKLKESKWEREKTSTDSKYENLEICSQQLEMKISNLEESLLLLTFIFDKDKIDDKNRSSDEKVVSPMHMKRSTSFVELTDVDADDYNETSEKEKNKPIPLPRTFIKSPPMHKVDDDIAIEENLPGSPIKLEKKKEIPNKIAAIIQTDPPSLTNVALQTDKSQEVDNETELRSDLNRALSLASERYEKMLLFQSENVAKTTRLSALESMLTDKEKIIADLKIKLDTMQKNNDVILPESKENMKEIDNLKELLRNLQSIESDKDITINHYKELLENEKIQHNKTNTMAQKQIVDMKMKIESLEKDHKSLKDLLSKPSHIETYNSSMEKYRSNIISLEDRCFQLQRDIENSHAQLLSTKSECDRWKNLAAERFANMEILNKRLEERHVNEVTSYKTETHHWISELSNTQQELSEIKMQFNEYKSHSLKEIAERHIIIDKLNTNNSNLKEHILNLQAVISMTDPTFEFAAIEDITYNDNRKESMSQEETQNFTDLISNKSVVRQNRQANSFLSDALMDRLRREKQILTRQNILLRKQIKVLGARERRSRLELDNIKSQMSKKVCMSGATSKFSYNRYEQIDVLLRKIESLESQLSEKKSTSTEDDKYREKQIVLWDKQKRWQESSERWKQQYISKCEQLDKLQKSFNSSKSILQRLEKEKRVLDSRLSKYSRDDFTPSSTTGDSEGHLEMLLRDKERLENEVRSLKTKLDGNIKQSSLMERLELQQRRIATLELAEKGKDVLITEYERLLAQNSLLAKQNIKLESEILENQLSNVGRRLEPDGSDGENLCCRRLAQQNQHLENYVKLLKEENSQLIAKNIEYNSLIPQSTTGTLTQVKRIADLERTVLTLRGLVSKLQADNKRLLNANGKMKDGTLNILREKFVEELKMEIERMKMVIRDKDELLDRSKELLRKAAEKERQFLNEIAYLKQTKM